MYVFIFISIYYYIQGGLNQRRRNNVAPNLFPDNELTENNQIEFDLDRPDFIVEANFLNVPLFSFDRNRKGGRKNSVVHRFIERIGSGNVVRTVTIAVADKEKDGETTRDHLPNAFDHDVWIVLMDLWDEQGRPDHGRVYFRQSDICKKLKITDGGNNYKRIRESLLRLKRTTIESKSAFYSAVKAKYVDLSVGFVDRVQIERSSRRSMSKEDLSSATISEPVLENLKRNYSARIKRDLYLQLDHGFSKRLANLITYQRAIDKQWGSFEFQLEELAQKLPMSGNLYPSQIIERLKPTLEELKSKNLFHSELFRINGKSYLRLNPMNNDGFLVGPEFIDQFNDFIYQDYGKSIESIFQINKDDILSLLEKYSKVIDFKKRKYSWVYHVLSVLMHQMVKNNYNLKAKDPLALIIFALKRNEIDIPIGFKPIDIAVMEMVRAQSKTHITDTKEIETLRIEQNFKDISEAYFLALSCKQLQDYENRIRRKFGIFMKLEKNSSSYISMIKDCIIEDMKNQKLDIERMKLTTEKKLKK